MKRKRSAGTGTRVVQTRVRRPIDKQLKNVAASVSTTQAATTLYTTTYPGTLVGLRWEFSAAAAAAVTARLSWAIIITRDGIPASTISESNGSDFYTPEANVLAFSGDYFVGTGIGTPFGTHYSGSTKAMRKLQAGDVLQCIYLSDTVGGVVFAGTVQFFIKS